MTYGNQQIRLLIRLLIQPTPDSRRDDRPSTHGVRTSPLFERAHLIPTDLTPELLLEDFQLQ